MRSILRVSSILTATVSSILWIGRASLCRIGKYRDRLFKDQSWDRESLSRDQQKESRPKAAHLNSKSLLHSHDAKRMGPLFAISHEAHAREAQDHHRPRRRL